MDKLCKKEPDNPVAGLDVARFSPRQGVGLFVNAGSANFRNVVIEPLEEGK
jgi:hypothetical protein